MIASYDPNTELGKHIDDVILFETNLRSHWNAGRGLLEGIVLRSSRVCGGGAATPLNHSST